MSVGRSNEITFIGCAMAASGKTINNMNSVLRSKPNFILCRPFLLGYRTHSLFGLRLIIAASAFFGSHYRPLAIK